MLNPTLHLSPEPGTRIPGPSSSGSAAGRTGRPSRPLCRRPPRRRRRAGGRGREAAASCRCGGAGGRTRVGVSSEPMHGTRPRRLRRSCLRPLLCRGTVAVRTVRRSAPSPRLRRRPRGRPGRSRGATAAAAAASPRGCGPRQRVDAHYHYIRRAVTVSRRRRRLHRPGTPWDDAAAAAAWLRGRGRRRRVGGASIRRAGSFCRRCLRRPGTSFSARAPPPPAPASAAGGAGQRCRRRAADVFAAGRGRPAAAPGLHGAGHPVQRVDVFIVQSETWAAATVSGGRTAACAPSG